MTQSTNQTRVYDFLAAHGESDFASVAQLGLASNSISQSLVELQRKGCVLRRINERNRIVYFVSPGSVRPLDGRARAEAIGRSGAQTVE